MRRFQILIVILFWAFVSNAQSQLIQVDAEQLSLNQILIQLRDGYNFQFSFSDNLLSKHKITIHQLFNTKDEVVQALFNGLAYDILKNGEVYIIIPKPTSDISPPLISERKSYRLRGQVVEAGSFEPLPFSQIIINNHALMSDVRGSFTYTASTDSLFRIHISHMGYYKIDTLIGSTSIQQFKLRPSTEQMSEIIIRDNLVERSAIVGDESGRMKLNHAICSYLPGQGDNSVFNLLRLMPGVIASSEQSSDLMIWGSYESHSRVTFDGFTLFGLKNFNDNISVVNPFMVKNMEVFKGGYGARYGDQVGALVNITGKDGSTKKTGFQFNINNTTLNGYTEIPIGKRASLQAAYRQTYYELYKGDQFNIYAPLDPKHSQKTNESTHFNIDLTPESYLFRDGNLKFTQKFLNSDLLGISLYAGGDRFNLKTNTSFNRKEKIPFGPVAEKKFQVNFESTEVNQQQGGSLFFDHVWNSWQNTTFTLAHSSYSTDRMDSTSSVQEVSQKKQIDELQLSFNKVIENTGTLIHRIQQQNGKSLETGLEFVQSKAKLSRQLSFLGDQKEIVLNSSPSFEITRVSIFAEQHLLLSHWGKLRLGMRATHAGNINQTFFDPRISLSVKLGSNTQFNSAWGIYHQYLYKILSFDQNMNPTYQWVTASKSFPVLKSTHLISGFSYTQNGITLSSEAFYKPTQGLVRSQFDPTRNQFKFLQGDSRSYGIDLYGRKDWGENAIWVSYLLSKTEERLKLPIEENFANYVLAPNDQRHELKVSGILALGDFYISANHVFGTGLNLVHQVAEQRNASPIYHRTDISGTYKFEVWGLQGETGLSILNIFNRKNIRYSNVQTITLKDLGQLSVYSNSVPFTPILFLKLKPNWGKNQP